MDIIMYVLFLAVGFAAGLLAGQAVWARRLDRQQTQLAAAPETQPVAVSINVSEELVARYLATFNLVAIPRDALQGLEDREQTRH